MDRPHPAGAGPRQEGRQEMEPHGKVILVTGASGGIGLECARALARAGARVVLAARSTPALAEAAAAIERAGGVAVPITMDVTCDASVRDGIAAVLARFGHIDAVVNNAGNAGQLAFWAATEPA